MSEEIGAHSPEPRNKWSRFFVVAEFVCTEEGDAEFGRHLEQTLTAVRSIEGCLHAVVWTRPNRRYRFSTLWSDRQAVTR